MTNRIGNKDEAHQRSKEEKARIKASNIAQEAVKKAAAAAKYHNEIKGQPRAATPADTEKSAEKKKTSTPVKAKAVKSVKSAKPAKTASKTTAAKTVKAKPAKAASDKSSKDSKKAVSDKATTSKKSASKE